MELESIFADIERAKAQLGPSVAVLVHHYQRDEVMRFADFRGDSLQLSRVAAEQDQAQYIVFCGVNFMAETAAMLCASKRSGASKQSGASKRSGAPHQTVIQPAGDAPCPMAQMADVDQAEEAWELLTALWGDEIVPITYQNSAAALKAFCGRHGGAVCTSSNAERLFRWAFGVKEHIFFFPDQWLGTNSALALGIPAEQIAVWDPEDVKGSAAQAQGAKVVVWKGYCHVHTGFTVEHVRQVRESYPGVQVIVHPECPVDVVQAADEYGSTAAILRYVADAPSGATIAVGTEINMVARLANQFPDKAVLPLTRSLCGAMYRTTPAGLRDALQSCVAGAPINVVTVDAETTRWANLALQRMLDV
jgi:quinolinate synthase